MPRSRRPSMSSGTGSLRSSLTTSQRTASTSPATYWATGGSRSATSGPLGGSRPGTGSDEPLEAVGPAPGRPRCRAASSRRRAWWLIAVLVGGLLFSWAMTGPQEADTLVALPEAQAVDDGMGRSLQNRIRQEAERQDSGGRRPGARRARAPAGRGRRGDGPAPDRVGDAEHRSLDPRRERGRVGA